MNRRDLLRGALLGGAAFVLRPAWARHPATPDAPSGLAALERRHGGRLGVAALDMQSGRRLAHRGGERFLMCSTFKCMLVAAVLARIDAGRERPDRRIVFDKTVLQEWSPVTGRHVGAPGMTVESLCEAAMVVSDNTAANLLLDAIGGPPAWTAWVRGLGDATSRLDRREPLLNRAHGDDDTTTPLAMLEDMRKVLLGRALSDGMRRQLVDWMVHNRTGAQNLQAGLPPGWRIGDKTGSGHDANNDIAAIWPPGRQPVLVTAFYVNDGRDVDERKAVLADVGRTVAAWVQEDGAAAV